MSVCPGCGGVVGRDCFNPVECEEIGRRQEAYYSTQEAMRPYIEQIDQLTATVLELKEQLAQALKYSVVPTPIMKETPHD